jgi:hypothetical protein
VLLTSALPHVAEDLLLAACAAAAPFTSAFTVVCSVSEDALEVL